MTSLKKRKGNELLARKKRKKKKKLDYACCNFCFRPCVVLCKVSLFLMGIDWLSAGLVVCLVGAGTVIRSGISLLPTRL